uniref:Sorting nexin n=1 Tax=Catharus ustulatus TaxID=91951 RepID=A0A8C3V4T6_CATUS
MALRARALYDFRSENPGEISLREHEVLSLCSEQDIEGWLEGINSHGDRGLFPASYVQVIRAAETPLPARYTNLPAGGLEPLLHPAAFNQGSDDDWDDDWDESSTVADEPGSLSSSYPVYEVGHLAGHLHLPSSSTKSSAVVSRNLNRFSTFVKSGGEAFVLGEVSGFVNDGDKLCVVLGPRGPEWQEKPYPFQCSIEDPTKQTKFKGMKSYIAYKLVSSHTGKQKFPVISVPHLPEKQATGRFEEDFISKRRKGLAWWMDHMCSHPVLAQCDAFQHFLTCPSTDEKTWKQGKRKAEKDEMVGANFFLTISVPAGSGAGLDLHEVESQVDGFKAFMKKMDESALQLNHIANEFARKQVTGFKKEYQKVGHSFKCLSQAFELDQQAFSTVYIVPTVQLFCFVLYTGALTKIKESKRHVEEGKMELPKAEGIQERCNIISFATLAEINHFHKIRVRDFKIQMQHFLKQQIVFFQKVTQKLEEALRKYDSV